MASGINVIIVNKLKFAVNKVVLEHRSAVIN